MSTVPSKREQFQPAPSQLEAELEAGLAGIEQAGLRRSLRLVEGAQDSRVTVDGREVLLFCSNNYLGLANHPEVTAAAASAARTFGAGAGSSRLISGNMQAHTELEAKIAHWKQRERAVVFSTGYQANVGVITALMGRGDVVVSDELNHASIIDGCRLSRAEVAVYRHNDVDDLRERLRSASAGGAGRILVVTESVFSMDGDIAPLNEIAQAARNAGAALMVDEAHAAGMFGPGGAGLVGELGLGDAVDIHMGTLGKALGSFGAYVAGSQVLIDTLINRARSFIFTNGLPPAAAAAASAAIDVIEREPERARGLLTRARRLGERLRHAGLDVPHLDSQILPVLIGAPEDAVAVANTLLEHGFYVAAIRPPTVPKGTSRLRLSLMATHNEEDIARMENALIEVVRDVRGNVGTGGTSS